MEQASPSRWHDPLHLIEAGAPDPTRRIVLWSVSVLVLLIILWAVLGQLDIIASADGKLASQTLVKVVQPADAGVVTALLVNEGDQVKANQVLVKLDPTLNQAEKSGLSRDLAMQIMQIRRIDAELHQTPMLPQADDDPVLFAQVQRQFQAHRQALADSMAQGQAQLQRAEQEYQSAKEILAKLEQTVPSYQKTAQAYAKLEKEGYFGELAAAEKQRDLTEKLKDLAAQKATVAALLASLQAEQQRVKQLQSNARRDLENERIEVEARITQLRPSLDKTRYKEGLLELRAPQDGIIKDLSTTTVGAVVQPGATLLTLVPINEPLFADVQIKNEDVGFIRVGQTAMVKLAAYPFQRYGMLRGKVVHISADANDKAPLAGGTDPQALAAAAGPTYKARIRLEQQRLIGPQGEVLGMTPGMQVMAEIHQGKRSVLEYFLSPIKKTLAEAGHER